MSLLCVKSTIGFPAHSMKPKFLQWVARSHMTCPPCFYSDLISYSSPPRSLSSSLGGLLALLRIHKTCFHLQAFPHAVPSPSILFPHTLLFQVFLFKCYFKNESFPDQIILNDILIPQPPPSHSPSILYFPSLIYFALLFLSSSDRQNILLISLVCCLPSPPRMYIILHDSKDFLLFFVFPTIISQFSDKYLAYNRYSINS